MFISRNCNAVVVEKAREAPQVHLISASKNVGYDIAKPDRHIRRILGSKALGCSTHEVVPIFETFDIVAALAQEMNRPAAEVDYILWAYCAKGYGAICTVKNPKCKLCVVKNIVICDYRNKSTRYKE